MNFSQIYQTYEKPIFNYLLRMVQNWTDAEDLTQEVFIKVYDQLSTLREESSLSTWMYRVATNLCLDHLRKKSSRQDKKTESLGTSVVSDSPTSGVLQSQENQEVPPADEVVIKAEMNACIHDYIDQLPEDYRAVIILSELQNLGNQEIAEILDCSLETVKIRLHRARKRLKETLEAHCTFYYNADNTLCCDKKL